jgi:hypothetical protein
MNIQLQGDDFPVFRTKTDNVGPKSFLEPAGPPVRTIALARRGAGRALGRLRPRRPILGNEFHGDPSRPPMPLRLVDLGDCSVGRRSIRLDNGRLRTSDPGFSYAFLGLLFRAFRDQPRAGFPRFLQRVQGGLLRVRERGRFEAATFGATRVDPFLNHLESQGRIIVLPPE